MTAEKEGASKPRKDKKVVVDEVWTPERVRSFLDLEPPQDWDADFNVLLRAYRSMRAEDFALFIDMFVAAGRSLDARGPHGKTILEIVTEHPNSAAYARSLQGAGTGK